MAAYATFAEGLRAQTIVIKALILRDFSSRFGRENIGFLWAIAEPFMLASVITIIHLVEPTHFTSDILPAPFAIIGYTIFIIFRGVVNKAEALVDQNKELFYHRRVSIFDMLLTRAFIETCSCMVVTFILLGTAITFGLASLPARPLYLLGAVGLMAWWSFALSMIVARVSYKNETIGRQIHVISYFCIPLSGAFWMLSMTPPGIRDALKWFPMTLIFEQARYGQFHYASGAYVNPGYVVAWCAFLTYLGLLLIRRLRSRL